MYMVRAHTYSKHGVDLIADLVENRLANNRSEWRPDRNGLAAVFLGIVMQTGMLTLGWRALVIAAAMPLVIPASEPARITREP